MDVNRQTVARKLMDYIYHRMTLAEVVDWAEWAMMDADFDARDLNLLREVIGRLGLADVRAFGITWDECENFLARLGYRVNITVIEAPALA